MFGRRKAGFISDRVTGGGHEDFLIFGPLWGFLGHFGVIFGHFESKYGPVLIKMSISSPLVMGLAPKNKKKCQKIPIPRDPLFKHTVQCYVRWWYVRVQIQTMLSWSL